MKTYFIKIQLLSIIIINIFFNQLSAQTSCFNPITCSSLPCEKISNGSINNFGFNVSSDYTPLNNYCTGTGSYVYCWNSSHGAACVTSISNTTPFTCSGWLGDLAMKAMGTTPAKGDGVFQDQTISQDKLYFLSYKYKVTNLTSPYYTLYGPQVVPSFGTLSEFNVKFILKSTASSLCSSGLLYDQIPTVTTQQTIDQITSVAPMGSYITRTSCIKANNNYDAIWLYPKQNAGTINSRISVDDISLIEVGAGPDKSVDCTTSAVLGEGCNIPSATFSWAPATGLSNPNILNPTVSFAGVNGTIIYTLSVTYNGCTLTDEVTVTSAPGLGSWDYTSSNALNGTEGFDIARDTDGSIYVCGTFENSATFPASPAVNISGAGTTPRSAYLAKFNACGILQWINYENDLGWSEGRSLVLDASGNSIFMAGSCNGTLRFQSTAASPGVPAISGSPIITTSHYVARFHKLSGAYIDAYAAPAASGYTNYEINSIALRKFTVATITFFNVFTCGSAYNTSGGKRDVIISNITKTSSGGYSTTWEKYGTAAATTTAQAWDIIYNPTGANLTITGDFRFQLAFQTSSTPASVFNSSSPKEAFICNFDPSNGLAISGSCKNLGVAPGESASGTALAMDAAGDVYYTGYFTGNLASTYGFASSGMSAGAGRKATYGMRTNPTGTTMSWRTRILTSVTGNCTGTGITVNSTKVFMTGFFEGGNLVMGGGYSTYVTSPGNRMFIASVNKTSGLLLGGNCTKSLHTTSDHYTTKISSDDYYTYTTGSYKDEIDYSFGAPASGALSSTSIANKEMFVIRNSEATFNSFRLINEENKEAISTSEFTHPLLFPNPTNGNISIKMQEELIGTNIKIEVVDINGRLLYSENKTYTSETNIDINKFDDGLYIINIKGENINHYQKIVKQ